MNGVFSSVEPQGFIKEYSDLILKSIPTSRDWAESIALTVESVVLSKVKVTTEIGPLSLNVWNLMIGPSGLAYKTTPLIYYVYPTLAQVTEYIDKPVIMPSRFSIEGFIEYVAGKWKNVKASKKKKKVWIPGYNEGCIVRDEFTTLFKESKSKQYLADIMEFLSELFDGTMQKRYTRKARLEQTKFVYISLLAATTPYLFSILERDFFVQGTGNRILYTIFKPSKPKVLSAEKFFVTGQKQREREEKITKFAYALGQIYKSRLRYMFPMEDAGKVWCKYKSEKDLESFTRYKLNPQDVFYTYLQRLPVMALKLAGLATISRSYETIPRLKGDTLMITLEDMQWAIMKTERHLAHFKTLLEEWEIQPREMPPEVHERELARLLKFVRDSPDGMLTQGELLSRSGMVKSQKFYELIATLVSRKELEVVPKEEIEKFAGEVEIRHGLRIFKNGKWVRSYRGQVPNVYRFVENNKG